MPDTTVATTAEWRFGFCAWSLFIAATCAYCLLYQALVAAVTPNPGGTFTLALREWGAWALLAPWAMYRFRRSGVAPGEWKKILLLFPCLAFIAACLPLAIDQATDTRSWVSSLALFWPRNLALAIVLYFGWRVFHRPAMAAPAQAPVPAPHTLLVSKGAHQCLIRVDDIQHVSAAGNYVEIHARDQSYLLRATMADLEKLLPQGSFVRVHRSHIVQLGQIERICLERSGSGTVYLRSGAALAISRGYRAQLKRPQLEALNPPPH
jgi:hypothetical protein